LDHFYRAVTITVVVPAVLVLWRRAKKSSIRLLRANVLPSELQLLSTKHNKAPQLFRGIKKKQIWEATPQLPPNSMTARR